MWSPGAVASGSVQCYHYSYASTYPFSSLSISFPSSAVGCMSRSSAKSQFPLPPPSQSVPWSYILLGDSFGLVLWVQFGTHDKGKEEMGGLFQPGRSELQLDSRSPAYRPLSWGYTHQGRANLTSCYPLFYLPGLIHEHFALC